MTMGKPDEAHQRTDEILAELEKRISSVYGQAARELQKTIDDYFSRFQERDAAQKKRMEAGEITGEYYKQWRLNQMGRGKRFQALRDQVAERITRANETAVAYANDATPEIYSLNRNYTAYTIEKDAGDLGFTLWDEATVKKMVVERPDLMPSYPKERAVKRGIDLKYGKKQITACVTSSILQGKSIKGIADDLQTRIPTMSRDSAVRTARTAATEAQNAGRLDAMGAAADMGITVRKQWVATKDGRTRHAHGMADGQIVPWNEPFMVDGYKMMQPGDRSAPGYLVYNCRCTMVTVEKEGIEAEPGKMRVRDPATGKNVLVDEMTYPEWEKWKEETQKSIANSAVAEYSGTIQKYVSIDRGAVYEAAKSGTRHKGVYNNAMKFKQNTLEKSIASHTAQVEEHAKKIEAPSVYDSGWGQKSQMEKDGLIRKWQKDMERNAEQASIEISVWKERFGRDD